MSLLKARVVKEGIRLKHQKGWEVLYGFSICPVYPSPASFS